MQENRSQSTRGADAVAQSHSHVESTQSQSQRILEYLLAGKRLTPLLALEKFGCFRLGGRVYDLKREGWDIQTEMITLQSGKRIAEYRIPEFSD